MYYRSKLIYYWRPFLGGVAGLEVAKAADKWSEPGIGLRRSGQELP